MVNTFQFPDYLSTVFGKNPLVFGKLQTNTQTLTGYRPTPTYIVTNF